MTISEQQLKIISDQLGRTPRGIVRIAASDKDTPLVLQMRSIVDQQPFPTLYWLSSKSLNKAIGKIEGQGWVKYIEARIDDDAELRASLLADQQRYVDQRWQLMHPDDKAFIASRGFTELFKSYGIGGITEWTKVRCLHMHYAHHLVEANTIGSLLDETFSLKSLTIHH